MKLTVSVKLLPTPDVAQRFAGTLELCNQQANEISHAAFERDCKNKVNLQKIVYKNVRASGLNSQVVIRTIDKVCASYATLKSNLKNGNYGKKGSKRYNRASGKPVKFRRLSSQPYDDRILTWILSQQQVSIWTISGGREIVAFECADWQLELLRQYRKGQSDLIFDGANWMLSAVVDIPGAVAAEPVEFLGVDLGIVNIATTSDDKSWSGGAVTQRRKKNRRLRQKLQSKGTKSAKRLLKKRSKKEERFVRDVNHCVSKKIVQSAQRTGRGIGIEDLKGIRERVRLRKPQRTELHSWAFAQLGEFLTYKAKRAGVHLQPVPAAYTSQTCSECGYCDKKNRNNQAEFFCKKCGVLLHADFNAARNIAVSADLIYLGAVNRPHAA